MKRQPGFLPAPWVCAALLYVSISVSAFSPVPSGWDRDAAGSPNSCPYQGVPREAGHQAEPLPSCCLVLRVILSFDRLEGQDKVPVWRGGGC